MCQFYGLKPSDLENMEVPRFEAMWKAITVIEAQETILAITVSQFPHMKDGAKKRVFRDLHRQAYPKTFEKPIEIKSGEDLKRILGS